MLCSMSVTAAILLAAAIVAAARASPLPNETSTQQQESTTKDVTRDGDVGHGICRLKTTDPFIHNQVCRA